MHLIPYNGIEVTPNMERRKAAMKEDRYLWLVASKADPKKEEEYNQWYDQHVATFFQFPGLKRVVRNKCYQPMANPDSCPNT
jgi:hypothetical protein